MSEITSQLHMLLLSCIAQLFVHNMYSHLSVLYCSYTYLQCCGQKLWM